MENNQPKNDTPWTEDLMTVFGFGKKEEAPKALPASIQTTGKAPWEDTETLWSMWTPKKPMPLKDEIESIFGKVIQVESRGKHRDASGALTTSSVGAQGITQIMPKTGKSPGYGVAPLKDDSEAEYLRMGKDLLRAYTREFNGDLAKGLAAYNFGPGNVRKTINAHGENWRSALPKETSNYLKKILGK